MSQPTSKIVIAAGGTGGHLFPAQALAQELAKRNPKIQILFSAAGLSHNHYFHKELFPFEEVSSATPFQRKLHRLPKALYDIAKGVKKSFGLLERFQPDLIIGFGSFHSFPLLFAAACKKVPIILFESNAVAGRVNRLFSPWARLTASQFLAAKGKLSNTTLEVSMPLWGSAENRKISKKEALAHFGLKESCFTFLVFGGSQGAASINATFCHTAALLLASNVEFQVIHIAGREKGESVKKAYALMNVRVCVKEFEEQMAIAWQAADMAICRAGAATLAELIAFEVPSLLIPFPRAAENHQKINALFMENEVKGGLTLLESELTPQRLLSALMPLLENRSLLEKMRLHLHHFKKRDKKGDLCSIISDILKL